MQVWVLDERAGNGGEEGFIGHGQSGSGGFIDPFLYVEEEEEEDEEEAQAQVQAEGGGGALAGAAASPDGIETDDGRWRALGGSEALDQEDPRGARRPSWERHPPRHDIDRILDLVYPAAALEAAALSAAAAAAAGETEPQQQEDQQQRYQQDQQQQYQQDQQQHHHHHQPHQHQAGPPTSYVFLSAASAPASFAPPAPAPLPLATAVSAPASVLRPSPAPPPLGRATSSVFTGATKHRRSGRWEAHIWVREAGGENPALRPGKQVYLGGHRTEELAARAYDIVHLKQTSLSGKALNLNFPLAHYAALGPLLGAVSSLDLVAVVRQAASAQGSGDPLAAALAHCRRAAAMAMGGGGGGAGGAAGGGCFSMGGGANAP